MSLLLLGVTLVRLASDEKRDGKGEDADKEEEVEEEVAVDDVVAVVNKVAIEGRYPRFFEHPAEGVDRGRVHSTYRKDTTHTIVNNT